MEGTLNHNKCLKLLQDHAKTIGSKNHVGLDQFALQGDNRAAHKAKSVPSYMNQKTCNVMKWPA